MRRRFWFETLVSGTSALMLLMTLLWKDWIELLLALDPDHHTGSLEWAIVGFLTALALASGAFAGLEWRHRATHLAR